jgi:hypothetical protein
MWRSIVDSEEVQHAHDRDELCCPVSVGFKICKKKATRT